jgi:hypothetical protein
MALQFELNIRLIEDSFPSQVQSHRNFVTGAAAVTRLDFAVQSLKQK